METNTIILTDRKQIAWLKWQLRNPSGISEDIRKAVEKEKSPEFIEERENMKNDFIEQLINKHK